MLLSHLLVRRRADEWLRTSSESVVPYAYAWRVAQLTSPRERRELAGALRAVVDGSVRTGSLGGRYRPRHTAARSRRAPLEALAATLERTDAFVTPEGMLRVRDLIASGTGPLWGTDVQALDDAIATTVSVLAPASHAA